VKENLIARLGALQTSALANALDGAGCHAHATVSLRPVCKGFRFAGRAVTVRERVGAFGSFTSEDFRVGAMIDAADPGEVIVIAAQGARASTWGGMASLAAQVKGIAGLVVDGGVRDLEEIEACRFFPGTWCRPPGVHGSRWMPSASRWKSTVCRWRPATS